MLDSLLNESQSSELLHCSVAFLRRSRLLRTEPQFVKIGRLVRYRLDDLTEYIERNVQESRPSRNSALHTMQLQT